MLAMSHAIVGASIAKIIPNPALAIVLSFLSHPVLDLIPHWDLNTRFTTNPKLEIILSSLSDAFLGFLLGYLLFGSSVNTKVLFAAMFSAQLIDWIEAPYLVFGWNFPPFSTIKSFQHIVHRKLSFPNGLYTQLILIFLFILLFR